MAQILHVESRVTASHPIDAAFRQAGYEVLTVQTYDAAVSALAKKGPFAAVLTGDGYQGDNGKTGITGGQWFERNRLGAQSLLVDLAEQEKTTGKRPVVVAVAANPEVFASANLPKACLRPDAVVDRVATTPAAVVAQVAQLLPR